VDDDDPDLDDLTRGELAELSGPAYAATYPDARRFGVPIEACADVPEGHVWIRTPATSAAEPDAPRCPLCCDHGIPRDGSRWCGWCDDILDGHGDDCLIPRDEPMWLCPHGIGKDV